jgi:hypothetical protein
MRRKKEDLWNAFFAQRLSLTLSISSFDTGMMFEAARIANAIFLLVGRGMRNHVSILDQLELQDKIKFIASNGEHTTGSPLAVIRLVNISPDNWMIEAEPTGRGYFEPKPLQFNDWWQQKILDSDGTKLTRNDLVRIIRDKDGGSHYDPEVTDPKARSLLEGNLGLYYQSGDGVRRVVPWGLHVIVRKVGEELRESIKYLELSYGAPFRSYTFLHGGRFYSDESKQ